MKVKKILAFTPVLGVLLLPWLMSTEAITFNRKSECEREEAKPPYYGSAVTEKQGPAHIFVNYTGIVISSSGKAFEFEFDKEAQEYIEQSGGVSLVATSLGLSKPSDMNEIDPSGTMLFWSWHNCMETASVGKTLEIVLEKRKQITWIPSMTIPMLFYIPQWNPSYIWPDPGDTFEQLEKMRRNWKRQKPPWWPPDGPWPPNDDGLWRFPPAVSRIILPRIFEEDSGKIARFLELGKIDYPSIFYIYISKINFDRTLLRTCVAIIKREPDGRITQLWIYPLLE